MKITGKIVSGVGESASFLSIPWVDRQIWDKLRFTPYKGTLNIMIDDPEIQRALKVKGRDRIEPENKNFCAALIFRGIVANKYECGVVLPLVASYDECLLEILAPVHLKDSLGLKDGETITLELFI